MPGAGSATYIVAAVATTNVPSTSNITNGSFTPGTLPQPTIDGISIQNGQYFLLTDQNDTTKNGLWFADANGPVAVMTLGGGVDPNVQIQAAPVPQPTPSQNQGTTWFYTTNWRNSGQPGFASVPV
jgi:hypothetical protein